MDAKKFYLSKTFWGAVMMLLASALHAIDVEFTAAEQSQAAALVMAAIEGVLALVGFVITIWGRATAKKAITLVLLLGAGLAMTGCSTVPADLFEAHLDAAEPHHLRLIRDYRPEDEATWKAHYAAQRDLVDAASGK